MYDRDLGIWYRDLFLRTTRRGPTRAAAAPVAWTAWRVPGRWADAGRSKAQLEILTDHERPQATH